MSDLDVLKAIEELERCLIADQRSLSSASIQEWQSRFQRAVATAERGMAWTLIAQKAQMIQGILEQTLIQLMVNRQAIECGMMGQTLRRRTLKTHRPGGS